MRLGVFVLSPGEKMNVVERARWAEEQGYDDVWIPDGAGKMHSLSVAAALAATTQRIRIGVGIVPVFTHTPAVLASATTAIADLAPGRFVLGMGSSTAAMIEKWHGLRFEKPLTRVHETVLVLRQMLAGEKSNFSGKTLQSQGFKLYPPAPEVPLMLAALRPKMLALAGGVAEGVILHLAPVQGLPKMLQEVAKGAKTHGRDLAKVEVALRLNVLVSNDLPRAKEQMRQFLLPYFSSAVYNAFLAWCGYEEAAKRIAQGFAQRNREATAAALTDDMVDALAVVGSAQYCRERILEFAAAGVHSIALSPIAANSAELEATWAALSPSKLR